jgi:CheY-like chemotaxis protein
MPGMDGFQLAKRLHKLMETERRIPIVAMTANADLGEFELFKAVGIGAILVKPFTTADLLACIENNI